MSQASGPQTLVLLVVMVVTTIWFTNIILKSLDILYKPKVNQWIRKKPGLEGSEFCPLNQPSCDNGKSDTVNSFTELDELAIKQLEEELMVLKALRGYSRPSKKVNSANLREDLPELASIKKSPRFYSHYDDAITDSSPDTVQEDRGSQRLDTLDYCTMNPYSNEEEQCGPNLNVVSSHYEEEDASDSLSPLNSRSFAVEEESDFETGHHKRCRKAFLWKDVLKLFTTPSKEGDASHFGICPMQT
ncbi:hypothetical protein TCAL_02472 [Tigriopus californicus]|uniref:Uncharacterized protein n=1 Tax=Tigriopus californicus TaxID=6832 RepID=A0A553NTB6_TIGCA|nr:uncharacterized protein LOC131878016 [Tigriopus californicus]XP_059079898.1 uncharacterized protein LOC131878016 [Tigriopus californicus]TRY68658.1 hypothetical protein TCAL_02472 [Tigriopus californicus]